MHVEQSVNTRPVLNPIKEAFNQRICQFNRVRIVLASTPTRDIANLSTKCGQAHLHRAGIRQELQIALANSKEFRIVPAATIDRKLDALPK